MISVANEIRGVKIGHEFGNRRVVGCPFSRGRKLSRGGIIWSVVTECQCGRVNVIAIDNLLTGKSDNCRSCHIRNISVVHGKSGTRLHSLWLTMRDRCRNPKNFHYRYYGGKGVQVCEVWDDFEAFQEWSLKNGYDDTLSIDRIKSDGHYEPENCQWITRSANSKKRWADKEKSN